MKLKVDTSSFRKDMQLLERDADVRTRELLERVGEMTVAYLRSYTEERKTPRPVLPDEAAAIRIRIEARFASMLRVEDPKQRQQNRQRVDSIIRSKISTLKRNRAVRAKRPLHPGHWGDVTRRMRDAYGYSVSSISGNRWALVIFNDSPHAYLVENRDGFAVVRGVTAKGGLVEQMLGRAMRELAPEWRKSA